jgi:hypothetical protein
MEHIQLLDQLPPNFALFNLLIRPYCACNQGVPHAARGRAARTAPDRG